VRKPYRLAEVLKRIEKLVVKESSSEKFELGSSAFYPSQHKLIVNNEEIYLNNYASEVLSILCRNSGNFIKRPEMIEAVWKTKDIRTKEGSLNNIMSQLRKYFESDERIIVESRIKLGVRLKIN